MAVAKEENAGKWQKYILSSAEAAEIREFLLACRILNIKVSQAEKAWEISFQCPYPPDEKTAAKIYDFWERTFGSGYRPVFYFNNAAEPVQAASQQAELEELCALAWPEIMEKTAQAFPSSRGWLNGAEPCADGGILRLTVQQELGCAYLSSQGFEARLEKLLLEEYNCPVRVLLEAREQSQEEPLYCADPAPDYIQKLENDQTNRPQAPEKKKEKVILGRKITGKVTPLEHITEEEKSVIIKAYIFKLEPKTLKSERTMVSFSISDRTDSLSGKLIMENKEAAKLLVNLKEKEWYLFRGQVQTDNFTQELTLKPVDIMTAFIEQREDDFPEKRVELHLHTKMSALDGFADVSAVIKRARDWGHPAVAVTDHGVVQSFPEAAEAAQKYGVKVIYGLEGYLYDNELKALAPNAKAPTYHCILLALNRTGLRNLYELVTLSHLKYFYKVPRLPKSEVRRLREGLLLGSACEAGELIQALLRGAGEDELEQTASFYDYLEVQPRGNNSFMLREGLVQSMDDILAMNRRIYELAAKLQKPLIATGDVHFLDPEDEVYRRILMAGKGFTDADQQAPLYYKTTREMLDEFAYLGEETAREIVIDNPRRIVEMAEEMMPIPSELFPPEIPGAEEEIKRLTLAGAHRLYGEELPEIVQNRIERELSSIINNGFAVLYLIAHKLVKKSNEDGYIVGSRGSVGSSLVATLCGITEVNPLAPHYRCPECKHSSFITDGSVSSGFDLPKKDCPHCGKPLIKDGHNILFEVFMGYEGDKVPDIDLNFSGEYQARAHKYTEELFGKDNVFRAGTIATIASKTAYGFVKNYFEDRKKQVRAPEINRLLLGCTGVKRTTGQHPGGIMVLPKGLDVHMFTPLQKPADDEKTDTITTHFDYHAISSRLVKLDILGHDDPTVLKMLEDLTGVDCRSLPLDDEKVLSLFRGTEALGVEAKELGSHTGTLGIPEFGTKFVRQMLEDTNPQNFSDLLMISGFSHGTDVWLNNAQDLIKSGTAKVSEVIATRDDIMIYLTHQGVPKDKAFRIMEDVRKGKGVRNEDVMHMEAAHVPDWYIASCRKIKYMFPKAHAAAYVMMALRIAWYKVYYPAAFYASFFTVRADEFDADMIIGGPSAIKENMALITKKGQEATQKEEKLYTILELALEMYLRGIRLERVSLEESAALKFQIIKDSHALLPPFVSLQGLGQTVAQAIVRAREEKPFISQDDLQLRAKVSKKVLEVLQKHGALEDLPQGDQISLF